MKKICLCFFISITLLSAVFPFVSGPPQHAFAAADAYARVKTADTLLYRNLTGETAEDVYFLLPEGYYVRLLGENTVNGKRAVEYDDLLGYVKVTDIEAVIYNPKYKFGSGSLKIDLPDGGSAVLRSLPDKHSQEALAGGIADGTENIKFYNLCDAGGTWYYIVYNGARGYLATTSVVVTGALPPPSDEAVAEPPVTEPPDVPGPTPPALDDGRIWLLVAAIGIPALIIILLIFRPGRRASKSPRRVPRYYDGD
ncbi:hypothetical protein FACS1894211_04450 [Clostridia bacterium]|nr:hypothetical protein FACS1894211_04450 [Clostridia bacterium]